MEDITDERNREKIASNLTLGIIGSILATIIVTISVNIYNSSNSLYGTWYLEESYGSNLSTTIAFHKDGSFLDGSVGAEYSAENGTLILYYNPLYGTSTYQYEIENRKLYLYKHEKLRCIYTKNKS